MAERDFQDFGPQHSLYQPPAYIPAELASFAARADTPRIWDSQPFSFLLLDHLSPFHDQV